MENIEIISEHQSISVSDSTQNEESIMCSRIPNDDPLYCSRNVYTNILEPKLQFIRLVNPFLLIKKNIERSKYLIFAKGNNALLKKETIKMTNRESRKDTPTQPLEVIKDNFKNTKHTRKKKQKHRHFKHHRPSVAYSDSESDQYKANNESQANSTPSTQHLQLPSSNKNPNGITDNVNICPEVDHLEYNTISKSHNKSTSNGLMNESYEDSFENEYGTALLSRYGETDQEITYRRYKRPLGLGQISSHKQNESVEMIERTRPSISFQSFKVRKVLSESLDQSGSNYRGEHNGQSDSLLSETSLPSTIVSSSSRFVSESFYTDSSDDKRITSITSTVTPRYQNNDIEGTIVQDKNKNIALRKIFQAHRKGIVRNILKCRDGKGKGNVIIVDKNESMRYNKERVFSTEVVVLPKRSKSPKKLSTHSLWCSIPLNIMSNQFSQLATNNDLANSKHTIKKNTPSVITSDDVWNENKNKTTNEHCKTQQQQNCPSNKRSLELEEISSPITKKNRKNCFHPFEPNKRNPTEMESFGMSKPMRTSISSSKTNVTEKLPKSIEFWAIKYRRRPNSTSNSSSSSNKTVSSTTVSSSSQSVSGSTDDDSSEDEHKTGITSSETLSSPDSYVEDILVQSKNKINKIKNLTRAHSKEVVFNGEKFKKGIQSHDDRGSSSEAVIVPENSKNTKISSTNSVWCSIPSENINNLSSLLVNSADFTYSKHAMEKKITPLNKSDNFRNLDNEKNDSECYRTHEQLTNPSYELAPNELSSSMPNIFRRKFYRPSEPIGRHATEMESFGMSEPMRTNILSLKSNVTEKLPKSFDPRATKYRYSPKSPSNSSSSSSKTLLTTIGSSSQSVSGSSEDESSKDERRTGFTSTDTPRSPQNNVESIIVQDNYKNDKIKKFIRSHRKEVVFNGGKSNDGIRSHDDRASSSEVGVLPENSKDTKTSSANSIWCSIPSENINNMYPLLSNSADFTYSQHAMEKKTTPVNKSDHFWNLNNETIDSERYRTHKQLTNPSYELAANDLCTSMPNIFRKKFYRPSEPIERHATEMESFGMSESMRTSTLSLKSNVTEKLPKPFDPWTTKYRYSPKSPSNSSCSSSKTLLTTVGSSSQSVSGSSDPDSSKDERKTGFTSTESPKSLQNDVESILVQNIHKNDKIRKFIQSQREEVVFNGGKSKDFIRRYDVGASSSKAVFLPKSSTDSNILTTNSTCNSIPSENINNPYSVLAHFADLTFSKHAVENKTTPVAESDDFWKLNKENNNGGCNKTHEPLANPPDKRSLALKESSSSMPNIFRRKFYRESEPTATHATDMEISGGMADPLRTSALSLNSDVMKGMPQSLDLWTTRYRLIPRSPSNSSSSSSKTLLTTVGSSSQSVSGSSVADSSKDERRTGFTSTDNPRSPQNEVESLIVQDNYINDKRKKCIQSHRKEVVFNGGKSKDFIRRYDEGASSSKADFLPQSSKDSNILTTKSIWSSIPSENINNPCSVLANSSDLTYSEHGMDNKTTLVAKLNDFWKLNKEKNDSECNRTHVQVTKLPDDRSLALKESSSSMPNIFRRKFHRASELTASHATEKDKSGGMADPMRTSALSLNSDVMKGMPQSLDLWTTKSRFIPRSPSNSSSSSSKTLLTTVGSSSQSVSGSSVADSSKDDRRTGFTSTDTPRSPQNNVESIVVQDNYKNEKIKKFIRSHRKEVVFNFGKSKDFIRRYDEGASSSKADILPQSSINSNILTTNSTWNSIPSENINNPYSVQAHFSDLTFSKHAVENKTTPVAESDDFWKLNKNNNDSGCNRTHQQLTIPPDERSLALKESSSSMPNIFCRKCNCASEPTATHATEMEKSGGIADPMRKSILSLNSDVMKGMPKSLDRWTTKYRYSLKSPSNSSSSSSKTLLTTVGSSSQSVSGSSVAYSSKDERKTGITSTDTPRSPHNNVESIMVQDNYKNDKIKKFIQSHRKEVVFNGGKSKSFIRSYDDGASSSNAHFLPNSSKDSNILTTKSIWSSIPSENINNPCSVLANSSDLTYSEHGVENKTTLVDKLNDFWKLKKEKNDSECNRTHVQVTKLPDDRSLELKESSSSMPNIFRRKFYRASELTASHATENDKSGGMADPMRTSALSLNSDVMKGMPQSLDLWTTRYRFIPRSPSNSSCSSSKTLLTTVGSSSQSVSGSSVADSSEDERRTGFTSTDNPRSPQNNVESIIVQDNYKNDKIKKFIRSHRKEVVFNDGKSKNFIRSYDEGASSSNAHFLPKSSKDSNILTTKSIWSSIPSENINNPCSVLANSSDLTYSEHGVENKTTLVAKTDDSWKLNRKNNDSGCNRTHEQLTNPPDERSLALKESSSSMPNIFCRKCNCASEPTATHATEMEISGGMADPLRTSALSLNSDVMKGMPQSLDLWTTRYRFIPRSPSNSSSSSSKTLLTTVGSSSQSVSGSSVADSSKDERKTGITSTDTPRSPHNNVESIMVQDNYKNDKIKKFIQSHRKEVIFNGGKSKSFIRSYDEGASSSNAHFLPNSSKDSNILTTKSIWSSIPSENINNPCSVLANSSDLTYSEHGMENKTTLVAKLNDFWKLNKEKNDSECNRTHVQVTKLPDDRSLALKESSSSMPNIFRRKFYRASELTASHATEKDKSGGMADSMRTSALSLNSDVMKGMPQSLDLWTTKYRFIPRSPSNSSSSSSKTLLTTVGSSSQSVSVRSDADSSKDERRTGFTSTDTPRSPQNNVESIIVQDNYKNDKIKKFIRSHRKEVVFNSGQFKNFIRSYDEGASSSNADFLPKSSKDSNILTTKSIRNSIPPENINNPCFVLANSSDILYSKRAVENKAMPIAESDDSWKLNRKNNDSGCNRTHEQLTNPPDERSLALKESSSSMPNIFCRKCNCASEPTASHATEMESFGMSEPMRTSTLSLKSNVIEKLPKSFDPRATKYRYSPKSPSNSSSSSSKTLLTTVGSSSQSVSGSSDPDSLKDERRTGFTSTDNPRSPQNNVESIIVQDNYKNDKIKKFIRSHRKEVVFNGGKSKDFIRRYDDRVSSSEAVVVPENSKNMKISSTNSIWYTEPSGNISNPCSVLANSSNLTYSNHAVENNITSVISSVDVWNVTKEKNASDYYRTHEHRTNPSYERSLALKESLSSMPNLFRRKFYRPSEPSARHATEMEVSVGMTDPARTCISSQNCNAIEELSQSLNHL